MLGITELIRLKIKHHSLGRASHEIFGLDLSDVSFDVSETILKNIQAVRKELWQTNSLNNSSEHGNLIVIKQDAIGDALEVEDRWCNTALLKQQVERAEKLRTRPLHDTTLRLSTYETKNDRTLNNERYHYHNTLMASHPDYEQRSFSVHKYDANTDTVTSIHGHNNVDFKYNSSWKLLSVTKSTYISHGGQGTQSFEDYQNPRRSFRASRVADAANRIDIEVAV